MYEQVLAYRSAMAQAGVMRLKEIITAEEYAKIDTMMLQKHGLSLCSIFRDIDLITSGIKGNMSHQRR